MLPDPSLVLEEMLPSILQNASLPNHKRSPLNSHYPTTESSKITPLFVQQSYSAHLTFFLLPPPLTNRPGLTTWHPSNVNVKGSASASANTRA
jgi:hypothetical protein